MNTNNRANIDLFSIRRYFFRNLTGSSLSLNVGRSGQKLTRELCCWYWRSKLSPWFVLRIMIRVIHARHMRIISQSVCDYSNLNSQTAEQNDSDHFSYCLALVLKSIEHSRRPFFTNEVCPNPKLVFGCAVYVLWKFGRNDVPKLILRFGQKLPFGYPDLKTTRSQPDQTQHSLNHCYP